MIIPSKFRYHFNYYKEKIFLLSLNIIKLIHSLLPILIHLILVIHYLHNHEY